MAEVFLDALIDTAKMVPFLLVIYAVIEYVEFKFGSQIRSKVQQAGRAGPALGAAFGSIPQCGFSVISTALYTRRLITVGTLLAVYLSTSDEAIPVILAQPGKIAVIWPLLAVKIAVALTAGYTIDLILNRLEKPASESEICAASTDPGGRGQPEDCEELEEKGCCGHYCGSEKPEIREMIVHPIIHTLKVFGFLLVVSVVLNWWIFKVGEENLGRLFLGNSLFQPVITALIGLVPNCAVSVAITQVFLKGGISFGSAVAGLCASAGLGMLILIKENRNFKDTLRVIGLLFGISALVGITIQHFYG